MPVITITNGGFFRFGGGANRQRHTRRCSRYEWSDQLSWNHVAGTRFPVSATTSSTTQSDEYLQLRQDPRHAHTFQTFSDFLLGMSGAQNGTTLSNIFTSTSNVKLFSTPNLGRENNMSAFAQDDFKVSPQLTLNLGVRWEYDGTGFDSATYGGTNAEWALFQTVPIPPASGTLAGFTVSKDYTGQVPTGVTRRSTNLLTNGHAPWDNFAPRIGFAWQPLSANGRFLVRGGSWHLLQAY